MIPLICFALFVFLTSAITAFGYSKYVRPTRILDRLEHFHEDEPSIVSGARAAKLSPLVSLFASLGGLLPRSPGELRLARRELASAGFRSDSAPLILAGIRIAAAAVLLAAALVFRDRITDSPVFRIVLLIGGAGIGYCAPGFILDRITSKRREQIRFALPDVLDLLVICSEVGCALDQSILNVSRELASVHPAICEELSLVNLEILAGASRSEALRSFAERTGEDEVKKLVAILVQTDKFGTSIAEALRTQSEYLRTRRRQEAEERAGKVGVKLVFPIFFFCMPSLLIVTAGPGMLQLMKNLLPAMKEFH